MAMVMMAAAAFNAGYPDVGEIETAYHTLTPLLGAAAAAAFLISLIASGISSSVVGTMAGQVVMQGFFRRKLPIWLRRLVTMIPALIAAAMGIGATKALVLSQVVLSIALPVPMIAVLVLSSDRRLMRQFANTAATRVLGTASAAAVLILNGVLLYENSCCALAGRRPEASRGLDYTMSPADYGSAGRCSAAPFPVWAPLGHPPARIQFCRKKT